MQKNFLSLSCLTYLKVDSNLEVDLCSLLKILTLFVILGLFARYTLVAPSNSHIEQLLTISQSSCTIHKVAVKSSLSLVGSSAFPNNQSIWPSVFFAWHGKLARSLLSFAGWSPPPIDFSVSKPFVLSEFFFFSFSFPFPFFFLFVRDFSAAFSLSYLLEGAVFCAAQKSTKSFFITRLLISLGRKTRSLFVENNVFML